MLPAHKRWCRHLSSLQLLGISSDHSGHQSHRACASPVHCPNGRREPRTETVSARVTRKPPPPGRGSSGAARPRAQRAARVCRRASMASSASTLITRKPSSARIAIPSSDDLPRGSKDEAHYRWCARRAGRRNAAPASSATAAPRQPRTAAAPAPALRRRAAHRITRGPANAAAAPSPTRPPRPPGPRDRVFLLGVPLCLLGVCVIVVLRRYVDGIDAEHAKLGARPTRLM